MSEIKYTRDSVVGYTGHVPKKNELYGFSTKDAIDLVYGTTFSQRALDVELDRGKPNFSPRHHYRYPAEKE